MRDEAACVILNYNDAEESMGLAERIAEYALMRAVVIVDNCSTDNSADILNKPTNKKIHTLMLQENRGYGAGNNAGVRYAYEQLECKYIIISNPDVSFSEQCLDHLLDAMKRNENIGVAAPVQYLADGTMEKEYAWQIPSITQWILSPEHIMHKRFWPSYDLDTLDELKASGAEYMEVDCVPGAFLMVDGQKFLECGAYDERNFLYCEETALAMEMKQKGYKTLLLINDQYTHYMSTTVKKNVKSAVRRKAIMMDSRCQFIRDWLKANAVQRFFCRLIADVAVIETWVGTIIRASE